MTMTKKLPAMVTASLGLTAAALLGASTVSAHGHSHQKISAEHAKSIALKDCGRDAGHVKFIKTEEDYKDEDHCTYDIEFKDDHSEYDYRVDAHSGHIVEKDNDFDDEDDYDDEYEHGEHKSDEKKEDKEDKSEEKKEDKTEASTGTPSSDSKPAPSSSAPSSSSETAPSTGAPSSSSETDPSSGTVTGGSSTVTTITSEDAKKIAIDKACVPEADATSVKVEKTSERSVAVYKVSFYYYSVSYSYTISCADGSVIAADSSKTAEQADQKDGHSEADKQAGQEHDDHGDDEDSDDEHE